MNQCSSLLVKNVRGYVNSEMNTDGIRHATRSWLLDMLSNVRLYDFQIALQICYGLKS